MVAKEITPQQVLNPKATKEGQMQQNVVGTLADEIAKTLMLRLPGMFPKYNKKPKKKKKKKEEKLDSPFFLDTSAIIDGRIFDVIDTGLLFGTLVVLSSILSELKHIADSQDMVKRERGQRGLARLEKVRKVRHMKFKFLENEALDTKKEISVDDKLILLAKKYKGRVITCDYNLEKKAAITGVIAINMHELANRLKVLAVPGETLHFIIQHVGKEPLQGVGYLEDGTMVVVEGASGDLEHFVNVVVSKVIQTSSGKILFAKKI